ncbi:thymidine phosphorylase family protein [Permianibacter sp. IMCC34836]|nr:thymidine phosphorylase family protein [Permianibacter fluminis]
MGIDTHRQAIAFMPRDCHACRSEGFNALSRVRLVTKQASVIATLDIVDSDIVPAGYVGLSESAWQQLKVKAGDVVRVSHAPHVDSLRYIRSKLFGNEIDQAGFNAILADIVRGHYSDVLLTAFVTSCAGEHMNRNEVIALTRAMVEAGQRLTWPQALVVDKHCVGGLPGNRTTPIVVAIAAANGLCIPKTSSRAITSPAGTADTMATLTTVELDLAKMREVVSKEGGCLAWGGAVNLSPADDMLIRIERALEIDSEGQLVASVLSKKIAAGASHVLIDIPVGPTAKVRTAPAAARLAAELVNVGAALGLQVKAHISDGSQPVGRGIGPALEAFDLLAVLQNQANAPADLRARAIELAAKVLELGGVAAEGQGLVLAEQTLASGAAWQKFQAICQAQGGLREPPFAEFQQDIIASHDGIVSHIDNRVLSRLAKLAGAPGAPAAGLTLWCRLGDRISKGDRLLTVNAESPGELAYALDYQQLHPDVIALSEEGA